MSKLLLVKSILTEYGIRWAFDRALYSAKLKLLNGVPKSEILFEKQAKIKRIDIITVDTAAVADFLNAMPQPQKDMLVDAADKAIGGKIKAFSSVWLDYGDPINWQLNPVTGESCRADVRWYKIADFDAKRGDIKLIWEASRLAHYYLFARAYMLTGDKKYYDSFSKQLADWLKGNPYPNGANYKCGQECALRMINALTVYSVFRSYGITNRRDKDNIVELTNRCYRKILSNFFYAHRCIKNNHTLSELCGMIIGAWCCEDDRMLNKAYRLLEKEICAQFLPDGGYRQFSFNYQRFAIQMCNLVISLSGTTGRSLSARALERICNSALQLYQCQSVNGDVPNYGPNDGALAFPVTCCGYRDFRPTINAAYSLTNGTRLYQKGLFDEELLWFSAVPMAKADIKNVSSVFADAGIYTLCGHDSMAMICLKNYRSRPTHMDQLHLDLWHKGRNIFCDCGTYSYASDIGEELVLTTSHNTAKIKGVEQMCRHSRFMIYGWSIASEIVKSEMMFEGVMTSQNGYSHKRRIELTDTGYVITDEVSGEKDFEILFHTPLQAVIREGIVILSDGSKPVCKIESIGSNVYLTDGYRSLYYLEVDKIAVIHLTPNSQQHRQINTIIKFMETA